MEYLWLAFGICIGLLIFVLNNILADLNPVFEQYNSNSANNKFKFEYTAPLFLLLYGMPTFVTGAACKFKPMLWGGLICWACCIITVYTEMRIDLALTAFSAIFAWFIPGVIMEKQYKEAKVALAQEAHV
jgi:hypothetical protein